MDWRGKWRVLGGMRSTFCGWKFGWARKQVAAVWPVAAGMCMLAVRVCNHKSSLRDHWHFSIFRRIILLSTVDRLLESPSWLANITSIKHCFQIFHPHLKQVSCSDCRSPLQPPRRFSLLYPPRHVRREAHTPHGRCNTRCNCSPCCRHQPEYWACIQRSTTLKLFPSAPKSPPSWSNIPMRFACTPRHRVVTFSNSFPVQRLDRQIFVRNPVSLKVSVSFVACFPSPPYSPLHSLQLPCCKT